MLSAEAASYLAATLRSMVAGSKQSSVDVRVERSLVTVSPPGGGAEMRLDLSAVDSAFWEALCTSFVFWFLGCLLEQSQWDKMARDLDLVVSHCTAVTEKGDDRAQGVPPGRHVPDLVPDGLSAAQIRGASEGRDHLLTRVALPTRGGGRSHRV
jgi:hypothetical protein